MAQTGIIMTQASFTKIMSYKISKRIREEMHVSFGNFFFPFRHLFDIMFNLFRHFNIWKKIGFDFVYLCNFKKCLKSLPPNCCYGHKWNKQITIKKTLIEKNTESRDFWLNPLPHYCELFLWSWPFGWISNILLVSLTNLYFSVACLL